MKTEGEKVKRVREGGREIQFKKPKGNKTIDKQATLKLTKNNRQ